MLKSQELTVSLESFVTQQKAKAQYIVANNS
jgi:hypothetical protein